MIATFKRWLGSVPARINGSAIDLRREEVTRLHALAPVTDTVRQAELERRQCLARETLRMARQEHTQA